MSGVMKTFIVYYKLRRAISCYLYLQKRTQIDAQQSIKISVVIPTCNRRERLLSLLRNLNCLSRIPEEIIVVDSGEQQLSPEQLQSFTNLSIHYLRSEKSVCIQRNAGIKKAMNSWIFLCDDDIEMPKNYLDVLTGYIIRYPETGAVSGVWLQKENNEWQASYPVTSARMLLWKYIFRLGIWGEIKCNSNNFIIKKITQHYKRKGNHISKAGWPVNTDFNSDVMLCAVYSLGAALVKKEWLLQSPYDEVLDRHGIGDNYGVIAGFPQPLVHVTNKTFIHHHREPTNRLQSSLQYYRRVLALNYFINTQPSLNHIKRYNLVWSLIGNLCAFLYAPDRAMIKAGLKSITTIVFNRNPYIIAAKENKKVIEPVP